MSAGAGFARRAFDRTVKPLFVGVRTRVIGVLEQRAGIRTEGHFTPDELGFSPEHRARYEPSQWFGLRRILPPRLVGSDEVFIDYGSGMGRIVYQAAAWYPFRRVIGIELSPRLNDIARDNIARNRDRLRCRDVELVATDALDYAVPDDVTVVYFGNPFQGPVFGGVVAQLKASLERRPRRMRIVYGNPIEEQQLLDAGFRLTRRIRGMRPTREWSRSNAIRLYER